MIDLTRSDCKLIVNLLDRDADELKCATLAAQDPNAQRFYSLCEHDRRELASRFIRHMQELPK